MAGAFVTFIKTILLPALISLLLYLSLTYAILPLYRRHHGRYAQYLPLTTISDRTSSFRAKLKDAVFDLLLPSSWRRSRTTNNNTNRYPSRNADDDDASLFDDEEGEGLVGFNINDRRRDPLSRELQIADTQRRLSRDLEEGFRDDSDEEADHAPPP